MEEESSISTTLGCRIEGMAGNADRIHTTVCVCLGSFSKTVCVGEGERGAVARGSEFEDVIFVYLSFGKT